MSKIMLLWYDLRNLVRISSPNYVRRQLLLLKRDIHFKIQYKDSGKLKTTVKNMNGVKHLNFNDLIGNSPAITFNLKEFRKIINLKPCDIILKQIKKKRMHKRYSSN